MFKKIALTFITWRAILFIVALASIYFLPVFGGRFPYVDRVLEITHLPYWIWGFGNFDGVHYLRIAQEGYLAQYSQAFFPLFPILVKWFSFIFPKDPLLNKALYTDPAYFYSGIILSNSFFLGALYIYNKLLNLDFKKKISFLSLIFLLVFPTSFYFGAIYTESLFFLLAVASIYLIRRKSFFWSAIVIALATATRIFGLLLILLYIIEVIKNKKDLDNYKLDLIWALITPIGLLCYMYFLKTEFNNPFYFLTSQPIFGASRSAGEIVLLPQVVYRYIKIFLTTNVFSLPFLNAFLEFIFTLIPLTFLILFFKKMRFSYWIFSISTLVLGTLTGTFSSMPRYALLSVFLLFPYLITRFRKNIKPVILTFGILGVVLLTLFIRGYWVA